MHKSVDDPAELIERLAAAWLAETELGQTILGTMSLDEAIDAIFSGLNAGLIKVIQAADGNLVGFTVCDRPRAPTRAIARPRKFVQ
jgi:hypothetical protein